MRTKLTCVVFLLALGILTTAAVADESYRITLNTASSIGTAQLKAGDYRVVVGGPKVVLTPVKRGDSIEVAGKVESVDKKFGTTEIHSKKVDGVAQIIEIRIGGSKTKITFE